MANFTPPIKQGKRQHPELIMIDPFLQSEGPTGRLLKKEADSSFARYVDYKQRGTPVPPNFMQIVQVINKSRKILDLKDNWDDEGSSSYSVATLNRAIQMLYNSAITLWQTCRTSFDAPKILPGPDGSIDIHWKKPNRTLLINVPADPKEPIDYYGNNEDGQIVKGILRTSLNNQWLLMWLMQ